MPDIMNSDQIIKGMIAMISARDWQGYLHFHRLLYANYPADSASLVRQMLKNLPQPDQDAYVGYFGVCNLPKSMRRRYRDESSNSDTIDISGNERKTSWRSIP
jgi:hypothetical protein